MLPKDKHTGWTGFSILKMNECAIVISEIQVLVLAKQRFMPQSASMLPGATYNCLEYMAKVLLMISRAHWNIGRFTVNCSRVSVFKISPFGIN